MRFVILLLFTPLLSAAQNLLLNGSFEEENICTEYIKDCSPEGWITTSMVSGHYFDDESNAFDGSHFIGILVKNQRFVIPRNYIRSKLLCGLRKGAQYVLEFYIRSSHNVLDSVGVYFSSKDIMFTKAGLNGATPQILVRDAGTQLRGNPAMEWEKVSFIYTGTGDEVFIVIGNFGKNNKPLPGIPDLGLNYYVFFDKVSLVPLNKNEKLCIQADSIRTEQYDENERHQLLDKKIYLYTRSPPAVDPLPKTAVQRIDTLIIPDVLFATNSYALNAGANRVLDSFISRTQHLQADSLIVEGHTDSTGSLSLNQKLSQNRAASVTAYLQAHFQVHNVSRGWASEKPVADNRTPAGRQKNRRVEIYLYVRE